MLDVGVDIIVGYYLYVFELIEMYYGIVIFYSLGNFVFD